MSPRDPDELELDAARTLEPRATDTPDVALTRRVGAAARALTHDDEQLDELPAGLWDRISGGVASAGSVHAHGLDDGPDPTRAAPRDDGTPAVVPIGPAPPRHLGDRPRRTAYLLGAAAAALLIVVGIVAVVVGDDDDGGTRLAQVQLEPLPAAVPGTEGAAASVVERDGARELDLALDIPAAEGFYEVWLIDENVEGMVSLGPLRADGRYQIPADVDIGAFPIVDVSIEPADGVPTHSGVSVLRGMLA